MNKSRIILKKREIYLKCKVFVKTISNQQPSTFNETSIYKTMKSKGNTNHIKKKTTQ
jgi:hypothetical protein